MPSLNFNKYKISFPTFLLYLLASAGLWSGLPSASYGDNLWDIYQIARQHNAQYLAAGYEHERAKLGLPLAKSALRPTLTVQGSGGWLRDDSTNNSGTNRDNQASVNAQLALYDRALRSTVTQAKLQVGLAKIRFKEAQDDLILNVAERYFQLLSAQDNKQLVDRQKQALAQQTHLASERLAVGLGTQTDLFDAQARFQQAIADTIQADNTINNAKQSLKQVIGSTPNTLDLLSDDMPLSQPDPQTADAWIAKAIENNLALRAANLNLKIAAIEIKKQRAARWPRLGLDFTRQQRDTSSNSNFPTSTHSSRLNATLTWPLYLGNSIYLQTKQAALQFNSAQQFQESMRRQIEVDTTAAYLAVVGGISQIQALAEAIRAGTSALQGKEQGFFVGLTTNIDVLDAQRDLTSSRTRHLRAKYDFILSLLRLEQSAGDLHENDLQRLNAWLISQ